MGAQRRFDRRPKTNAAFERQCDAAHGRDAGALYAWNTAGAVAGALLTPFLLVPLFGVRGAGLAASLACLATAGLAAWLSRRASPAPAVVPAGVASDARDVPRRRFVLGLLLYACAGGIAMGYEVLWTQIVAPLTSTRGAAFAVVLAVYLAGLAGGSAAWSRVADRIEDRWASFGLLIAGAGLLALLTYAVLGPWLATRDEVPAMKSQLITLAAKPPISTESPV